GLEPDFTNEDSTEVEADHVISTDPPEGEEVEVGATVSVVLSSGPDSVTVPDDLQGMTREEAAQALEEVGLDMVEGDDEDVAQEANTVSRSDPQPGASAPRGSEVEVRFASGNVPLPDVVGTQEEAATETLEGRDFVVNVDTRPDTDANPGSVLSPTPDADAGTAPYGSTVALVVGVAPGPVTVPNGTGRTLEDARRILGEEGFGIETEREASDSVEEDQVIRTEPGANEEVERGSTIVIVVSTGPEETPSPTPTETPTDEPTDEPTDDHTDDPTDEPTDDPTAEPSCDRRSAAPASAATTSAVPVGSVPASWWSTTTAASSTRSWATSSSWGRRRSWCATTRTPRVRTAAWISTASPVCWSPPDRATPDRPGAASG